MNHAWCYFCSGFWRSVWVTLAVQSFSTFPNISHFQRRISHVASQIAFPQLRVYIRFHRRRQRLAPDAFARWPISCRRFTPDAVARWPSSCRRFTLDAFARWPSSCRRFTPDAFARWPSSCRRFTPDAFARWPISCRRFAPDAFARWPISCRCFTPDAFARRTGIGGLTTELVSMGCKYI
jgi:hypothetical protein